ncbi:hypothetical protein F5X68DRAFT_208127 [Plectosphaerella plurivora]|uniref:Uncharacterized protein n=1 Tax=Plectosphaerella plurivora TaxID=936078 RepID=A0A9P9AA62_9PEZI|nr:hypothetical protein F5X68DRAFT_208127 [Plectosphaerella plurivora]
MVQMEVLWFWHSYLFHAYLQHSRRPPGAGEPAAYWITQLAGFLPVIIDTAVHLLYPDVDTPRDFLIDLVVGLSLVLVYPVSLVPVATGFFPQGRRILTTLETNASFAPPLARQAILTLFIGLSWCYRPYLFHQTSQNFQSWYLNSALPQWEGAAFAIAHSLLAVAVPQNVPAALTRQTQAHRPWTFLH